MPRRYMLMRSPEFQALTGAHVWTGEEIRRRDTWRFPIAPEQVREIDVALQGLRPRDLHIGTMRGTDFPLPTLGPTLARLALELEEGCGMAHLSGLPVKRYSADELELIFAGLCAHLGRPVQQNAEGQLLRPICDEGPGTGERYGQLGRGDGVFLSSRARVASTGELRFHTDRTDVVALLCVRQARAGGISKLASTAAVHNEILRRRPDLLALLYQDYHRSRLGEERGGETQTYALPVLGVRDGKLTSHYSRTYIEAAQLLPDVPRMSDAQWEALDLLAEVAERQCLEMRVEPGDMQFLNNHVIYHARTAFQDDAASGRDRLLYRIWLSVPNNRALPAGHEVLWGRIEAGELRGGIRPG